MAARPPPTSNRYDRWTPIVIEPVYAGPVLRELQRRALAAVAVDAVPGVAGICGSGGGRTGSVRTRRPSPRRRSRAGRCARRSRRCAPSCGCARCAPGTSRDRSCGRSRAPSRRCAGRRGESARSRCPAGRARVHAARVAVPDLDRRALDRLAARRVDDGEAKRERDPGLSLGDVASDGSVVDVVRPLGLLGCEDARDEPGGDRSRPGPGSLGVVDVQELASLRTCPPRGRRRRSRRASRAHPGGSVRRHDRQTRLMPGR